MASLPQSVYEQIHRVTKEHYDYCYRDDPRENPPIRQQLQAAGELLKTLSHEEFLREIIDICNTIDDETRQPYFQFILIVVNAINCYIKTEFILTKEKKAMNVANVKKCEIAIRRLPQISFLRQSVDWWENRYQKVSDIEPGIYTNLLPTNVDLLHGNDYDKQTVIWSDSNCKWVVVYRNKDGILEAMFYDNTEFMVITHDLQEFFHLFGYSLIPHDSVCTGIFNANQDISNPARLWEFFVRLTRNSRISDLYKNDLRLQHFQIWEKPNPSKLEDKDENKIIRNVYAMDNPREESIRVTIPTWFDEFIKADMKREAGLEMPADRKLINRAQRYWWYKKDPLLKATPLMKRSSEQAIQRLVFILSVVPEDLFEILHQLQERFIANILTPLIFNSNLENLKEHFKLYLLEIRDRHLSLNRYFETNNMQEDEYAQLNIISARDAMSDRSILSSRWTRR